MNSMNLDMINLFVLKKQHLADDSKIDDIVHVVRDIGGLHAQVPQTPYLSLFARTRNITKEDLDSELYSKKNLGRIKCIRSTLYILPKDMIAEAFAATRKMVSSSSGSYAKRFGITREKYEEISRKIVDVVHGRGMTTKEITKELGRGSNISLIVNLMCDQGLLIRGIPKAGWKSNVHTYYPFNEFFPDVDLNEFDKAGARISIIKKYLVSFAPAFENDIAWWTGFSKGEVRKILEELGDSITRMEVPDSDGTYIMLCSDKEQMEATGLPKKKNVNLLPVLDPYIMGYEERERYLDPEYYDYVFDFNGNAAPTILIDGRVVGVWDFMDDARPLVRVFLFEDVEMDALKEIHVKALGMGKFISGKEVQIKKCDSMVPLKRRTAGGYMSPLKE